MLQFENYILYVTGQRTEANDESNFKFANLLSALKHAYVLHLKYTNLQKVTLYINESVDHFITASDFSALYPLIEEQYLLNASYSLEIMQEQSKQIFLGHLGVLIIKISMSARQKQKSIIKQALIQKYSFQARVVSLCKILCLIRQIQLFLVSTYAIIMIRQFRLLK
ncbi:hypothetical protein FGO68_gene10380 [Halteria grandinella]|uniref:Uncharacterized protein n=1 Tax=Halteria grandinella TaxID=5974 RepID=A0A8J8P4R9_HALGN|nr:hypothetical protein FGO68_gene10380 [Halteria grandinella]